MPLRSGWGVESVSTPMPHIEGTTFAVALFIHGGFIAVTLSYRTLPHWLTAVLGGLLLTWYGSYSM